MTEMTGQQLCAVSGVGEFGRPRVQVDVTTKRGSGCRQLGVTQGKAGPATPVQLSVSSNGGRDARLVVRYECRRFPPASVG